MTVHLHGLDGNVCFGKLERKRRRSTGHSYHGEEKESKWNTQRNVLFFMMEESKSTYCSAIGRRWLIYEETNQSDGRFQVVTVQVFLEWVICLRNAEPKGKPKLILLVYNFQGFNGYFVRKDMSPQQIVMRPIKTPVFGINPAQNQIHRQLEPFPMPLADFLDAFCLQEEAKGFFPPSSPNVCGAFAQQALLRPRRVEPKTSRRL